MLNHNQFRFEGDRSRFSAPLPAVCNRGGPVHKIDDVLVELLDQYSDRFPELRVAVVSTPAEPW